MVGAIVQPSQESEAHANEGALPPGCVIKPDEEDSQAWAAELLRVPGYGQPCKFCQSKYHSRGGWYPFRSVVVSWKSGSKHYYKAGDEGHHDLVQAGQ